MSKIKDERRLKTYNKLFREPKDHKEKFSQKNQDKRKERKLKQIKEKRLENTTANKKWV